MTPRRPRDIGTDAEREVLRACQRAGLPAHRTALAGSQDLGDVHVLGGTIVLEVKGGAQARRPSWAQLRAWWAETQAEAARVPACDVAVLIVRRWGSGRAEDWTAYLDPADLEVLRGVTTSPAVELCSPCEPVALRFGALTELVTRHYRTAGVLP